METKPEPTTEEKLFNSHRHNNELQAVITKRNATISRLNQENDRMRVALAGLVRAVTMKTDARS